ncbi:MAG TPA: aquaporin [Acidobacteriota bacterium]|nr:aquaporin [Acidobacteriota bacterium]
MPSILPVGAVIQLNMGESLKLHWPEYLMEGICLGLFMISAFTFASILEHPSSPIHQAIPHPLLRRFLMGLAMGGTAIGIIYSPWGKQSGAHINPSVTLTFYRLGKVAKWDALLYVTGQFIGATIGALVAAWILSAWASHPAVNFVITAPGRAGASAAFFAEILITFILMTVILRLSNNAKLNRFTGLCAGALVAIYITFEAPISGMSMNPARTLGSAISGNSWHAIWVYFTAPLIGMLAAAEFYVRTRNNLVQGCAKLHHENGRRCIFCGKTATR